MTTIESFTLSQYCWIPKNACIKGNHLQTLCKATGNGVVYQSNVCGMDTRRNINVLPSMQTGEGDETPNSVLLDWITLTPLERSAEHHDKHILIQFGENWDKIPIHGKDGLVPRRLLTHCKNKLLTSFCVMLVRAIVFNTSCVSMATKLLIVQLSPLSKFKDISCFAFETDCMTTPQCTIDVKEHTWTEQWSYRSSRHCLYQRNVEKKVSSTSRWLHRMH